MKRHPFTRLLPRIQATMGDVCPDASFGGIGTSRWRRAP
jgi:hypothetical protein